MAGYDGNFSKRIGRQSLNVLGVCNTTSTYDRKAGLFGNLSKSPPGVRKTLFEARNKENEESMLCTDFTDREATGKSPVIVLTRPRSSISNEVEEKKIKPRKSMLGFRSKTTTTNYSKDDSTYILSKPLHSSSPLAFDSVDNYKSSGLERRLQKATSTPTLTHPFDMSDPDASSFFTKGHSDSTWSVFKSTKNPNPVKSYPQEPVGRVPAVNGSSRFQCGESNTIRNGATNWKSRQSLTYGKEDNNSGSSMSVDQKLKLEWLSLKYKNNNSLANPAKEKMDPDNAEKKKDTESYGGLDKPTVPKARTRAQAKKEKEENLFKALSPIIQENDENGFGNSSKNSSISLSDSLGNSSDSYVKNEATIVGRSNKKFMDIDKEIIRDISTSSKPDEINDRTDYSDEYLSTNEEAPESLNIINFLDIINNLKKDKEELNLKITQYQNKLDNFMSSLDVLANEFQKGSKSKENVKKTPLRHRKKKVIAVKGRHSNTFSPATRLSKSSKAPSKKISDLQPNTNCFKTPNQINKKNINRLRKSTCYTPNSLSVLVGDQFKDIFGEM